MSSIFDGLIFPGLVPRFWTDEDLEDPVFRAQLRKWLETDHSAAQEQYFDAFRKAGAAMARRQNEAFWAAFNEEKPAFEQLHENAVHGVIPKTRI